ncbi:MAG: hypothetical protein ACYDG6_02755 [Thermincolia bacterium]
MVTWEDLKHDILLIITIALVILFILGLIEGAEDVEQDDTIAP